MQPRNTIKMWIFDEKLWPSQAWTVPPRYAAKRLEASNVDVEGPRAWEAEGYSGERYIAALAGRLTADGKIEGDSLVDLAPHVRDGKLAWQVPAGKWKIIKFTHVQAPPLSRDLHGIRKLGVDGASKDSVDWFLQTVYQPHYDHFKADFGKTISGFFYEPETWGDWGTEMNHATEWKVVEEALEPTSSHWRARSKSPATISDAFAEAWGTDVRRHQLVTIRQVHRLSKRITAAANPVKCAGDMTRLQKYSDMGAIDAVFRHFEMGKKLAAQGNYQTWQVPKLGSSISHVYGKPDDVATVEMFGARGQDLTYPEMKWWTDHMQVSGVNSTIPASFNPRAPYDTDCPPYFYNGGYESRWPLYRVYADYTSRLSLMLTGGRHVCPVALLFLGQSVHVRCAAIPEDMTMTFDGYRIFGSGGFAVTPEDMTTALQDAQIDCDWMPYEVFEGGSRITGKELQLHKERYKVLIVPPVEVIPYATLVKVKEFYEAGGGHRLRLSAIQPGHAGANRKPSRSPPFGRRYSRLLSYQLRRRPLVPLAGKAHFPGVATGFGRRRCSSDAGSARGRNQRLAARVAPSEGGAGCVPGVQSEPRRCCEAVQVPCHGGRRARVLGCRAE